MAAGVTTPRNILGHHVGRNAVDDHQSTSCSTRHPSSASEDATCDDSPAVIMKNVLAGVEAAPVILEGPQDVSALVGDRVLLQVLYSASPSAKVTWRRAGRELKSDERIRITCAEGQSSILLQNITADESGKYDVSVANGFGVDTHFASVSVEGPPDPPSDIALILGERNARPTITWSSSPYDGGRQITGYSVEYSVVGSSIWHIACAHCHSLRFLMDHDLEPGARYVFRVRANNVHGSGEPTRQSEVFYMQDEKDKVVRPEARLVLVEPGVKFTIRYATHEVLGKGRFGVVHRVVDARTNQSFAAKFIRCRTHKDKDKVREEIAVMNQLRHAKLLQLAGAFEHVKEMIMVMEFISGGELFERVVADDFTLTEKDCIVFMRQICEGVAYMHSQNVAHLDLKPENIMCHNRTSHEIKIIDFGLAHKLDPTRPVRVLFGTPEFIPPEIINYEPISVASDMWSVGVICYVLLSGLSPFMGDNDPETFANITRADYDFEDEAFDAVSQNARDFIRALLKKRKEDRMSAVDSLRHRWLDPESHKKTVVISTDKLKKFIIRRKWQKTGNAIRALGRMATLSASRRNSAANSSALTTNSELVEDVIHRMECLDEEDDEKRMRKKLVRTRNCSERSDSGISDCSALPGSNSCTNTPLMGKKLIRNEVKRAWADDLDMPTIAQSQKAQIETKTLSFHSTQQARKQSVANQIQKFDQLERQAGNGKMSGKNRTSAMPALQPYNAIQLKQPKTICSNGDVEIAPVSVKNMKSIFEKPTMKSEHFQKVTAFWNKHT